jgi:hypothetical protein
MALVLAGGSPTFGAPPLYWCPDRPADQQIGATAEPGCRPLVDKKPAADTKKPRAPIKIENFQAETSAFLQRYRRFLDCCASDLAAFNQLEELEDQAADLLRAAEKGLFSEQMKLRGFTLRELIPPVARARDDLAVLKARLERLGASKEKLDTLGYEAAGRERRRLQGEEESLQKEFRPAKPPDSARTGTNITDTTVPNRIGITSGDTTLPNTTGTDAANSSLTPSTGADIGVTPQTGPQITDTTLPNRTGFETETSTLPKRVGPNIGDSSLNKTP